MSCIFCMIGEGTIKAATLYEDSNFIVFLDIAPATKGHCLVVPKAHYPTLLDMPTQLLQEGIGLAQKVMGHLSQVLGCDGYNLVQNNGQAGGQTVDHFHIHLIPRYAKDDAFPLWKSKEVSSEEIESLVSLLKI